MAELVNELLQDLGLLSTIPGTFPELLTWLACSSISCALVAGVFKTLLWGLVNLGKVGS